jgi:hypothetical protein
VCINGARNFTAFFWHVRQQPLPEPEGKLFHHFSHTHWMYRSLSQLLEVVSNGLGPDWLSRHCLSTLHYGPLVVVSPHQCTHQKAHVRCGHLSPLHIPTNGPHP